MNTILILKIFLTSIITWLISSKALKSQDVFSSFTISPIMLSVIIMVSFVTMFVTALMLIWGIQ